MADTEGAVAPYNGGVLSGVVTAPAANPNSHAIHKAFLVLHKILDGVNAYHDELSKHDAHRALDAFKHVLIPKEDHQKVISETDPGPVEDPRLRRVPGAPPPVSPFGPIDYHALAEAIVAVQNQQRAAVTSAEQVHVITDAAE